MHGVRAYYRPGLAAYLSLALLISPAFAGGHIYPERHYQQAWCDAMGGQMEVMLPDRTRVDCLTDEYAVEVDFAPKWAEAIGQSLYYAHMTGKKPGVLLIMEHSKDQRYLERLNEVAKEHHLKVWKMMEWKDCGVTPENMR